MDKRHDVILTTAQIQHIRAALEEYLLSDDFPKSRHNENREIFHGLWDVVCNDVLFAGVKQ